MQIKDTCTEGPRREARIEERRGQGARLATVGKLQRILPHLDRDGCCGRAPERIISNMTICNFQGAPHLDRHVYCEDGPKALVFGSLPITVRSKYFQWISPHH